MTLTLYEDYYNILHDKSRKQILIMQNFKQLNINANYKRNRHYPYIMYKEQNIEKRKEET